MSAPSPPPELRARVAAAVRSDMQPLPVRTAAWRAGVGAWVLIAMLGATILTSHRGFRQVALWGPDTWAAVVASLVAALFYRGSVAAGRRYIDSAWPGRLALGAVFLAWGAWVGVRAEGFELAELVSFGTLACLFHGVAMVAGFLLVVRWMLRGTDPFAPTASAALLGAAAGLVAAAGVSIGCAALEGAHVLVAHWLVIPMAVLAAMAMLPRALRP